MNKLIRIVAIVAVAAGLSGCATKANMKTGEIVNNVPQLFYNQPNNALMQEVTGTNVTWSITGANRIAFYAPIPPKQMLPRDPTWIDSLGDVIKTVAPWVAVGYLGTHVSTTPATTVRGATTVTLPAAEAATP